jgi:hypothetical protein
MAYSVNTGAYDLGVIVIPNAIRVDQGLVFSTNTVAQNPVGINIAGYSSYINGNLPTTLKGGRILKCVIRIQNTTAFNAMQGEITAAWLPFANGTTVASLGGTSLFDGANANKLYIGPSRTGLRMDMPAPTHELTDLEKIDTAALVPYAFITAVGPQQTYTISIEIYYEWIPAPNDQTHSMAYGETSTAAYDYVIQVTNRQSCMSVFDAENHHAYPRAAAAANPMMNLSRKNDIDSDKEIIPGTGGDNQESIHNQGRKDSYNSEDALDHEVKKFSHGDELLVTNPVDQKNPRLTDTSRSVKSSKNGLNK